MFLFFFVVAYLYKVEQRYEEELFGSLESLESALSNKRLDSNITIYINNPEGINPLRWKYYPGEYFFNEYHEFYIIFKSETTNQKILLSQQSSDVGSKDCVKSFFFDNVIIGFESYSYTFSFDKLCFSQNTEILNPNLYEITAQKLVLPTNLVQSIDTVKFVQLYIPLTRRPDSDYSRTKFTQSSDNKYGIDYRILIETGSSPDIRYDTDIKFSGNVISIVSLFNIKIQFQMSNEKDYFIDIQDKSSRNLYFNGAIELRTFTESLKKYHFLVKCNAGTTCKFSNGDYCGINGIIESKSTKLEFQWNSDNVYNFDTVKMDGGSFQLLPGTSYIRFNKFEIQNLLFFSYLTKIYSHYLVIKSFSLDSSSYDSFSIFAETVICEGHGEMKSGDLYVNKSIELYTDEPLIVRNLIFQKENIYITHHFKNNNLSFLPQGIFATNIQSRLSDYSVFLRYAPFVNTYCFKIRLPDTFFLISQSEILNIKSFFIGYNDEKTGLPIKEIGFSRDHSFFLVNHLGKSVGIRTTQEIYPLYPRFCMDSFSGSSDNEECFSDTVFIKDSKWYEHFSVLTKTLFFQIASTKSDYDTPIEQISLLVINSSIPVEIVSDKYRRKIVITLNQTVANFLSYIKFQNVEVSLNPSFKDIIYFKNTVYVSASSVLSNQINFTQVRIVIIDNLDQLTTIPKTNLIVIANEDVQNISFSNIGFEITSSTTYTSSFKKSDYELITKSFFLCPNQTDVPIYVSLYRSSSGSGSQSFTSNRRLRTVSEILQKKSKFQIGSVNSDINSDFYSDFNSDFNSNPILALLENQIMMSKENINQMNYLNGYIKSNHFRATSAISNSDGIFYLVMNDTSYHIISNNETYADDPIIFIHGSGSIIANNCSLDLIINDEFLNDTPLSKKAKNEEYRFVELKGNYSSFRFINETKINEPLFLSVNSTIASYTSINFTDKVVLSSRLRSNHYIRFNDQVLLKNGSAIEFSAREKTIFEVEPKPINISFGYQDFSNIFINTVVRANPNTLLEFPFFNISGYQYLPTFMISFEGNKKISFGNILKTMFGDSGHNVVGMRFVLVYGRLDSRYIFRLPIVDNGFGKERSLRIGSRKLFFKQFNDSLYHGIEISRVESNTLTREQIIGISVGIPIFLIYLGSILCCCVSNHRRMRDKYK